MTETDYRELSIWESKMSRRENSVSLSQLGRPVTCMASGLPTAPVRPLVRVSEASAERLVLSGNGGLPQ